MIIDKFPKTSAAPTFSIDSPGNFTLFGKLVPNYSLTITEGAGNFTWYEFLEIGVNSTPIELEGTPNENIEAEFNQTMWNSLSNGTATVRFYVNNSLGELGYLDAIIRIDILDPVINIISPTGGFFNSTPPDYTIEISDPNLNKTWYTLNTNQTKHIFTSNGTIDGWSYLNDGIVTITFYANDSVSNENSDSVQVTKDIVDPGAPSFLTSDPSSWTNVDSFNLSWSNPVDTSGITGAYYKLDSVPSTDTNGTYVAGSDIESIIGISVTTDGNHTIYVWLNDTAGNIDHTNYTTTQLYLDTTCPLIIDSQSGDDIWRNTAGTTYDVNFNDSSPSSNLDYAQYIITNETGQGGTVLKDWTDIFTDLGATSYNINWTIDFDLCQEGFNYISVRVYDEAGNYQTLDDVFYVKKDTTNPIVSDLQDGDVTWRNTAGTTYDVDFSDSSPSSNLDYAQYIITNETGQGGTVLKDWTNIFTNLGATSYDINWTIDFDLCQEGFNYISVRVYDEAGNYQTLDDVFYVKKDTTNPLISDLQDGDDIWRNTAGTTYDVDFSDSSPSSNLDYAQYIITNETGQGGTVLKDWTNIFTNLGATSYINNWTIDFDSCQEGFNYISVRVYDEAGNYETLDDVFYVKKDTTNPLISDLQDGDDTWRNIASTTYDVDFSDPSPSSNLDYAQYIITSETGQGGTVLKDWTNIFTNLGLTSYTTDWSVDFTACKEGINYISVRVYDETGNFQVVNDVFYIKKDTINPILVLNTPVNNTCWNTQPPINITVYEPNLGSLTYTVIGYSPLGLVNNTDVLLSQVIWNDLPQGEFRIVITSFDILGQSSNLNITLYKDTIAPSITINSPVNNTFWNSWPYLNITAFDPNLDTIWYSVNNVNTTLSNNTLQQLDMLIWDGLPDEGEFEVQIYANDSFGHLNDNYILTLYKDVIAPSLIINSPLNNTFWNSRPYLNITAIDPNLDTIWYSVNNVNITLQNNTLQQLDISIWTGLLEEVGFIIYFYANDSIGNLNDLFRLDLNKDIRNPVLTIINPNSDDLFGDIAPDFEISISELNLNQTWYMLYNQTWNSLNYSFNELTGKINQVAWDGFWNGTVTIRFYANDTLNHLGFIEVSVRKNIFAPIITIVSPENNDLFGIEAPNITIYKSGLGLSTTWYTINYGATNFTFSGLDVVINQTAWDDYDFSDVTITFYINDTFGKIGSDTITVRKDPDPPVVTIIFIDPYFNNTYCADEPIFRVSVYEPNNHSIWYRVGTTNIFISNYNNTDITLDSSIWNGLPQGTFTIEVFANDTLGYMSDVTLTFLKDTIAPQLVINQPVDYYYNSRPPINITVYDPNFASLTYTVVGYTPDTFPLANNTEELLNGTIWNSLSQGEFLVSLTARDSFGHTTFYLLTLYKDTIAPSITINSPGNNTFWNLAPSLNVTALDPNLDTIWYITMGTKVILSGVETLDLSIWNGLSEGPFTIEFYANDTFGYTSNSVNLTLIKDITIPMITINSPENNMYYSTSPIMDITISDFNPDTIWYIAMGTKVILSGVEPFDLSIWNSLGQGEFQINIFANDTAGNLNDSIILTLYKDDVAPLVTVNLPLNNTHWNTAPIFNVVAYDPNPVSISYQVVGYSLGYLSNNTDELLYIWGPLLQGIFFVDIFVVDSLGNLNDSIRLTLYKDTDLPEIDIILPQPNDIYGDISPDFDISISELNLNQTWYMLYNQTWNSLNYLFNEFTGKINQTAWDGFWNGTVTIRLYANDTAGNVKYKDIIVRKNIYDPIVTITSPRNNNLFGIAAPNFIIYKSGPLLNSTWYTLDNGITNITFTGLSGTISQTVWDNFGFGIITLKFYVNDSFGKIGFDEVSIRKDPDMPIIIVNSPINQTAFASSPFINLTIIEPNLYKVWYRINNNLIDITDNTTIFIDFFIWNSLPQGEFNVELFANDTMGNINCFNILYLSKDIIGPNITIIQPNENQKVDRNAPYFELLIFDENGVDSSWYTIGFGENTRQFTGLIGRIDQNLWEQIWDDLPQGAIITIRFYAKDTLGNENFTELNLIVEKPLILPKFLSDPLGLILLSLGLVAMIPFTIKLTKSRYYKSLNNKDKGKLNKLLIASTFLLSLAFIFYFV